MAKTDSKKDFSDSEKNFDFENGFEEYRKPARTSSKNKDELQFDESEPIPLIKKKKEIVAPKIEQQKYYIRHPLAKKGLIKINRDNVYIYKTEPSKKDRAVSVRIGMFDPSNLTNSTNGNPFNLVYTTSDAPLFMFDYEWPFYRGLGILSYKVGSGIYIASGNGRFENGNEAPEKFTFLAFPSHLSLNYRFKYWDKQFLIPHIEAGVDAIPFAEHRDDNKNPAYGAALGLAWAAHGAAGVGFDITHLSSDDSFNLDREYGINSLWIILEFRAMIALSDKFDFSSNVINAGIHAEF